MVVLKGQEPRCEICGCRESDGHVDQASIDESFKREPERAALRIANNTESIRKRVLAAGNGTHHDWTWLKGS